MNVEDLYALLISYGSRIVIAVVVFFVGKKLINMILQLISATLEKNNFDQSLRSFIMPLNKAVLNILLFIAIASILGAEMTSFAAIIASAGFAVGMALQGSLGNFAGGILILILRPFEVGNYIEAGNYSGTVEEIQIFYTIMRTPDNRRVFIPNAQISNSNLVNYSANPTRRVDMVISVSYDEDINKVKGILKRLAHEHPLVLSEPAPMIALSEHGHSSLNFNFRVWTKTSDYWPVRFDLLEKVKIEFDKEGVKIPYQQVDLHIRSKDNASVDF
jgi:small conductance mechanosensitive channel